MTVHHMTIRLYLRDSARPDVIFRSKGRTESTGARLRIGWWLVRLGSRIMLGKEWEQE